MQSRLGITCMYSSEKASNRYVPGETCLILLCVVHLCGVYDWRDKVGHDDCSAKVLGSVRNHSLQTSSVPQMQVPVVRPADGQLLCWCRC